MLVIKLSVGLNTESDNLQILDITLEITSDNDSNNACCHGYNTACLCDL